MESRALKPRTELNEIEGMEDRMQTITLDIESYFDKQYSLKKLATYEYVRDPRFKVHGVGVKIDDRPTEWWTNEIEGKLKAIDWANTCLIGHNLYFDATILFEHYGIVPARRLDTLSIAKALLPAGESCSLDNVASLLGLGHKIAGTLKATEGVYDLDDELLARLGAYCIQDVELTHEIFLKLSPHIPPDELDLIDLTLRMATAPRLHVDLDMALRAEQEAIDERASAIEASGHPEKTLSSNKQFSQLLADLGIEAPTKVSKTTGEETEAFGKSDPEFIELMAAHPEHQKLWKGRLAAKSTIKATRAKRWVYLASQGSKMMPMPLNYFGAHTGRWSGMDKLNVQNLPRGGALRKAIHAPKGHVVVVADSSQIEMRMNAWFAGQTRTIERFKDPDYDPYREYGAIRFGCAEEDLSKELRQFSKATVLGCIAEDTLVLTKNGLFAAPSYTPIQYITNNHLLWDGNSWVSHQGLIKKGEKDCIHVLGIWMTPDHELLCDTTWTTASAVVQDANILSLALETGSRNLPSQDLSSENAAASYGYSRNAVAEAQSTESSPTIYEQGNPHDATHAQRKKQAAHKNNTSNIWISSRMTPTENDCSTVSAPSTIAALTPMTTASRITGPEESPCINPGAMIELHSYPTLPLYQDGTLQNLSSIESTTIKGTNPKIYDSFQDGQTVRTKLHGVSSYSEYTNSNKKFETYDIAFAGPNNRFAIKCRNGHLIAHNCGYGMGPSKFKHFCASGPLGIPPMYLSDDEAMAAVYGYRNLNAGIVGMWRKLDDLIGTMLIQDADIEFQCLRIQHERIQLPNGLWLDYSDLRATESGWLYGKNSSLWGGTLDENIIQALARIVIGEQMLQIDRLDDVQVVGCTHDEIISVCPEEIAEDVYNECVRIMSIPPVWAEGLPLSADGGWARNYSK